jgi:multiple sugar transport system substrate-binding protein
MRRSAGWIGAIIAVTGLVVLGPLWTGGQEARFHFTVWGMPFEDRLFEDGYARDFEARHPGLVVRYDRYADLTQKYYAWHLRGTGADVMRLTIGMYEGMVRRGLLEPLDDYMDDPDNGLSQESRADFAPSIWEALSMDGKRYALPSDHNLNGLFWNRAVFEDHNRTHPDALLSPPGKDWTWADLEHAARVLTVRTSDGTVTRSGIDFLLAPRFFFAFLAQAGGQAWDPQGTTTLVNGPAGVEALDFMMRLLVHTPSVRATSSSHSATGPDKLFASGRTAMLLDGSWRAPALTLAVPTLDFAIAPLPHHKTHAVYGASVLWAVGVHAEDKALAWDMVRWMTDPEQALRYWHTLRVAPPARISVLQAPGFRSTPGITQADGTVLVPAMPRERFEDWGAWLLDGLVPDPATGKAPAFLVSGPYQRDLERAIKQALIRAASPTRSSSHQALLDDVVVQVHGIVDRDRATRGLPTLR